MLHINLSNFKNVFLRLDNTGAWAMEGFPALLSNQMTDNVDLYIK